MCSVLSLPSLLWRDFSSLTLPFGSNETHMNYISVIARLLCDKHIPYDVIILGYPRENLFNDTAQLNKLVNTGQYSMVILPMVDSLSEIHVAALRSYALQNESSLVVVAPESTATLTEELLPRTADRSGPTNVFAGVPFASVPQSQVQEYYEHSNETAGDEIYATIAAARRRKPELVVAGAPPSLWVGSVFTHGGSSSHADGSMRSISLVNYDLKLSPPQWYSLQPRNVSLSAPACGSCGDFVPVAAAFSVSVRCPSSDCTSWQQPASPRVARVFTPEASNATALHLDFTASPGYAMATIPAGTIRSFAVVVVGAQTDEIEARAAAAELRRWINRAVTQAEGVAAAGVAVSTALRDLQQIHGLNAPLSPPGGFAAAAASFRTMAGSMRASVEHGTVALEQADADVKSEAADTPALLKLDAGSAQANPGFQLLTANTSATAAGSPAGQISFGWVGNSSSIVTADCQGNENHSALYRTALWSEKPAILRLRFPVPGLYTITLWVGNCFTDQSGAFSPWTGYGHKGEYCVQGACEQMASKVAVSSVSLITTGTSTQQPTITPVLLGDRTANGFVAPRVFTYNASSIEALTIDMRLTGSTGTSFLNRIAWSLSAVTVTTAK